MIQFFNEFFKFDFKSINKNEWNAFPMLLTKNVNIVSGDGLINCGLLTSVRNQLEKLDRFSVYSFDQLIGSDWIG